MNTASQEAIVAECNAVRDLLLAKNREYGDSALHPLRCFSKASAIEQIKVRIDDKLSRIATVGAGGLIKEDTVQDLIGYLVLYRVAQRLEVSCDQETDARRSRKGRKRA